VSVSLSMEAEYAALCEVSHEIIYIKQILIHMGFEKYIISLINVFCDNQSAIELSRNAIYHKHSKYIHASWRLVEEKEIAIRYLQTNPMLADIFTKALSKCKHLRSIEMLNRENI